MIIDAHAHYTTAPPQLQQYRGQQITNFSRPAQARLQVSDEQLERTMSSQFQRMEETGIDRLMFSPQASAMGHQFGGELISRYWSMACNDIIGRIGGTWPDKVSPVCQLPQAMDLKKGEPVPPERWVDELERCVNELGFVACNVNPNIAGGLEPLTPSMASEWWYPLWEKMEQLDVPGTVHASASMNPGLPRNEFLLHLRTPQRSRRASGLPGV